MPTAEDILNRAIDLGNEKSEKAEEMIDDAITASFGSSGVNVLPTPATPAVVEPPVNIPANATGLDTALFDSTYERIITDFSDKYAEFLTLYFPVNAALINACEAWMTNAIVNGGSGINAAVEGQIWQRARDRISVEAGATQNEAVAAWAARGFPMPPGAAIATIQTIQQKRNADLADVSRQAAIKAFETEIENVRFAIKTAIDYRVAAVQAAGDYIRVLALGPQIATQIATAASDAQARLIGAASSYYNARISVAQLAQQRNLAITDLNLRAALQTSENTVNYSRLRADTAMGGAQALGQQASAALNAVNATVQVIEATA